MSEDNDRSNKRARTSDDLHAKFHEGLFETSSLESIRKSFMESKPYLHCKIEKLINDDLLRRVRKEIFDNLHFTLKETDIYKVFVKRSISNCSKRINVLIDNTRYIKRAIWQIWTVSRPKS